MPTKRTSVKAASSSTRRGRPMHAKNARRHIQSSRHWSRHVLLHPTSVFCLLLVGVLLVGLSARSVADILQITATVPADPLTVGAVIESPADGATVTTKPIAVTGSCPDDSYVKLYRNGMFSGVDACVSQAFSITTDLFVGRNTLKVQAYNITDQAGPDTPSIDITYSPPVTEPAAPNTPATTPAPSEEAQPAFIPRDNSVDSPAAPTSGPLLIWTDYRFNVVTTKADFSWSLRFQFGQSPYTAQISWGDGQNSRQTVPNQDTFTIRHSYAESGYYRINVVGRDRNGQTSTIQLAALVKKPGALGSISSIVSGAGPTDTPSSGSHFSWIWLAWPTYAVVVMMVFSFWLGERREFLQLINVRPKAGRRRHA